MAAKIGYEFRNLLEPKFDVICNEVVPRHMRDGAKLIADVYRPTDEGKYPVLVAVQPTVPVDIRPTSLSAPCVLACALRTTLLVSRWANPEAAPGWLRLEIDRQGPRSSP